MGKIAIPLYFSGKEEIFTHELNGVYRHFPVRVMYEVAQKYANNCKEIIYRKIDLCPKHCEEVIKPRMGIEQWRVDRLKAPWLNKPMVAIQWDGGEITIVDGNHRFVKLAQLGINQAKCYIFKRPAWEQMLLPDHPAFNMLGKESGILEHENTEAICE